jgi:hypothetical protein
VAWKDVSRRAPKGHERSREFPPHYFLRFLTAPLRHVAIRDFHSRGEISKVGRAMVRKGRPTTWTEYQYYRLFQYVTYRRGALGQSVRCACRDISQREPWHSTGLSAETLRRRFGEAGRLWAQGKLGRYTPLDFNFALNQDDLRDMMTLPRYLRAMAEYHAQSAVLEHERNA